MPTYRLLHTRDCRRIIVRFYMDTLKTLGIMKLHEHVRQSDRTRFLGAAKASLEHSLILRLVLCNTREKVKSPDVAV